LVGVDTIPEIKFHSGLLNLRINNGKSDIAFPSERDV
jgi:hypothetical protein